MNNSDSNEQLYELAEDALITLTMRKMIQIHSLRQLPEKRLPIDPNDADSLALTATALAAAVKARRLSECGEASMPRRNKVDEILTNFTQDIETILSENDIVD